jgi:hypothetical protein
MLPVNAIRVCLLTLAPTTAVGVTNMFSKWFIGFFYFF